MSDQDDLGRKAWVRGEEPTDPNDEFARHAARGRGELGSKAEAQDLLNELDGLLDERFGGLGADVVAERSRSAGAKKVDSSKVETKVRRLPSRLAVAAAILLLVAAGFWWMQQPRAFDAETVYASAFEPYANDLGGRAMGGNEPGDPVMDRTLAAASLAYDRRDYAAAADSFALQLSTAPAAAATSFYYGLSLLGANRNQQAIDVLSPLGNDAEYGPAANWYRALALLRSKQLPAAKTALSGIANNESSPFKSAAEKLLQRLP